jgi:hypothetical protein
MTKNPFDNTGDPDRHYIWQRLIIVDCEAFVAADWSRIEGDFDAEQFEGIRCGHSTNPGDWTIAFPRLCDYRDSWLAASREFLTRRFAGDLTHLDAVLLRCRIDRIDIAGDRAIAHKKFCGEVALADGTTLCGNRQTLYRLHRRGGTWKIVGFLGQLPLGES